STGTGVGQFFSSLFGGSSSAPPTSTQVTGSLEPAQVAPKVDPAAKPVRVAAAGPAAAAKPAPVTTVRPAAAANAVPVTNIQPATAVRPSRPTGPGKFEIEVAQLRDKYRAEALAKQLVVQYSRSSFWSPRQTARVHEEPGAGEEGSVYSVRYGVYSSKAALSSMCDRLKAGGLDCEPVRQN
ncbi:MAG: SPOR domain-containing protein, partial [Hyphomicrobiaceae bacterium]